MRAGRWPARVLVAALAVLAAGCELRAVVVVDMDDGGGGRLSVSVEADEDLAARAAAQPLDPLDHLAEVGATLAPEWETDDRPTVGGGRSVTLASGFDGPGELEERSAALADALAAPELDPLDRFTVAVDAGEVRVAGRAALEPTAEVAALGLDPPRAVAALSEAVDYRVRVRVPGEVVETTADEQEDGRLLWRVPAGGSAEILAVAARRPSDRRGLAAGGAALAVVAGLAGWWLARRRRRARGGVRLADGRPPVGPHG